MKSRGYNSTCRQASVHTFVCNSAAMKGQKYYQFRCLWKVEIRIEGHLSQMYCMCIRLRFSSHQIFACFSVNFSRLPHSSAPSMSTIHSLTMPQIQDLKSNMTFMSFSLDLCHLPNWILVFESGMIAKLIDLKCSLSAALWKQETGLKQMGYLNLTLFKSLPPPGKFISVR
jgi:hypothetical protein